MRTIAIEHFPRQSSADDLFNIGLHFLQTIFWPLFFLLPLITGIKIMVTLFWRIFIR